MLSRSDQIYKNIFGGLTWILYWIMCVNNTSGPDQNNELSVLHGNDGSVSPDSPCLD